MIPITTGSVMAMVAAVMNDSAQQNYTDAAILPYMQLAYEDLKTELQDYNIPITNATSSGILITPGVTTIGGVTGPSLPADLVDILSMHERIAGTTSDFVLMERKQFLPMTQQLTSYLQVWSWQDQIVRLLGANGNVEVRMNYIASNLGDIADENTILRLFNLKGYLTYRTGGHCSIFIGENETRANVLYGFAERELDKLLSIGIKAQQAIRTRRRPFRSGFKSYGTIR
jgi:hypothetical protein